MSNRNPRERFDYQSWFDRNVAKRAEAALAERDAAFAEKYAETPLIDLARYLVRKAELIRHTPSPCEVDGGAFIEERFGSWGSGAANGEAATRKKNAATERDWPLPGGKESARAAVLRGI